MGEFFNTMLECLTGVLEVSAILVPQSVFNSDDLPTFDLPAIATC
jgi:hypothetical protein